MPSNMFKKHVPEAIHTTSIGTFISSHGDPVWQPPQLSLPACFAMLLDYPCLAWYPIQCASQPTLTHPYTSDVTDTSLYFHSQLFEWVFLVNVIGINQVLQLHTASHMRGSSEPLYSITQGSLSQSTWGVMLLHNSQAGWRDNILRCKTMYGLENKLFVSGC